MMAVCVCVCEGGRGVECGQSSPSLPTVKTQLFRSRLRLPSLNINFSVLQSLDQYLHIRFPSQQPGDC